MKIKDEGYELTFTQARIREEELRVKYNGNLNSYRAYTTEEDKKEYNKENQKEYYEKNKEHLKKHIKEYRENNKEKIKEKQKEYYENNKEKLKEWIEKNILKTDMMLY